MEHSQARAYQMRYNAAAVEPILEALLTPSMRPGEIQRPLRQLSPMRGATLGGGMRLRPFLVIETARLHDAIGPDVLDSAAALEMMHCHSPAHDDLLAMDDGDTRRGQPTPHKPFDKATALTDGEALPMRAHARTHSGATLHTDVVVGLARRARLGTAFQIAEDIIDAEDDAMTVANGLASSMRAKRRRLWRRWARPARNNPAGGFRKRRVMHCKAASFRDPPIFWNKPQVLSSRAGPEGIT